MNRDYEEMKNIESSIKTFDLLINNYMQYMAWENDEAKKALWQEKIKRIIPIKQKLENNLENLAFHINANLIVNNDEGLDSQISSKLIV